METVQPSKSKVVHKAHHLCFFQWTLQMQFFFVFVVTVLQILIFTAWNDVHKFKKKCIRKSDKGLTQSLGESFRGSSDYVTTN